MHAPLTLTSLTIDPDHYASISAAISPVCVPISTAEDEDIVGVLITFETVEGPSIFLTPIYQYVRKTADDYQVQSWGADREKGNEPQDLAMAFARLATLRTDLPDMFRKIIGAFLQPGDSWERIALVLTPSGATIIHGSAMTKILGPRSWDQLEPKQSDIDDCLRLILPPFESDHDRLARSHDTHLLFDLATSVTRLIWESEDFAIPLTFTMPR